MPQSFYIVTPSFGRSGGIGQSVRANGKSQKSERIVIMEFINGIDLHRLHQSLDILSKIDKHLQLSEAHLLEYILYPLLNGLIACITSVWSFF